MEQPLASALQVVAWLQLALILSLLYSPHQTPAALGNSSAECEHLSIMISGCSCYTFAFTIKTGQKSIYMPNIFFLSP